MELIHGNCLDKLKELEENSIDSIVTDPPYGLSFMGKKWDYDVLQILHNETGEKDLMGNMKGKNYGGWLDSLVMITMLVVAFIVLDKQTALFDGGNQNIVVEVPKVESPISTSTFDGVGGPEPQKEDCNIQEDMGALQIYRVI